MMNSSEYVLSQEESVTIYKRGFFFEAGKIMVQLAKRNQVPLLVAVVEIDKLSTYDEQYGEGAADKLLELLTKMIVSKCRTSDLIASMGDGRVGIVFYNITNVNAKKTLESLYQHIADNNFLINQEKKHIDMHIGGTIMHNQLNAGTINSLFEQACIAVETVKKRGNNEIIVY